MSPGFTPRPSLSAPTRCGAGRRPWVSPGFTPRPSLSGARVGTDGSDAGGRVAGVHAPAFVERGRSVILLARRRLQVSPGFTPRPSLSGAVRAGRGAGVRVSPGFTPRPSLSGRERDSAGQGHRVSPGFTPRPSLSEPERCGAHDWRASVAGVHAPAFVERRGGHRPGPRRHLCRRGSRPGLR